MGRIKMLQFIFLIIAISYVSSDYIDDLCAENGKIAVRCRQGPPLCCSAPKEGKDVKCSVSIIPRYCAYFDIKEAQTKPQNQIYLPAPEKKQDFKPIVFPPVLCNGETEVQVSCPILIRASHMQICCPKPASNKKVSCAVNHCRYDTITEEESKPAQSEFQFLENEYLH
jgi:hypothetical protein